MVNKEEAEKRFVYTTPEYKFLTGTWSQMGITDGGNMFNTNETHQTGDLTLKFHGFKN